MRSEPLIAWALLGLGSSIGLPAPAVTAQAVTATQPSVHIGPPPPSLWGSNKGEWKLEFGLVTGTLSYDTSGKRINIEWRYRPAVTADVALEESQAVHLSYWPTEVLRLNPNEFLVAGKRERGATVIEKFTISTPTVTVPPPPYPPQLSLPSVTSVDEIFSERAVGIDMVFGMHRMKGASNAVLVQFFDSRDIYRLDLNSESYSLAASPSQTGAGVLTDINLANDFSRTFSRHHVQFGYMYCFHAPESASDIVCLVDDAETSDDVLDYVLTLSVSDWENLGLSNPVNYQ